MTRDSLKIALVLSLVFNVAVIGAVVYGFARRSALESCCPRRAGAPADSLGSRCSRLAREIGLPQERAVRFSHAMANSSGETRELRRRLQKARGELVELMSAPEPDEKVVMAKVDEISAIQGELEKRLITRLLTVSTILKPEERARFMHVIRCRCMPCARDVPNGPEGAR